MRIRTFPAAVVLASLILGSPAWAELIHLQDGTTIQGDIKRAANG